MCVFPNFASFSQLVAQAVLYLCSSPDQRGIGVCRGVFKSKPKSLSWVPRIAWNPKNPRVYLPPAFTAAWPSEADWDTEHCCVSLESIRVRAVREVWTRYPRSYPSCTHSLASVQVRSHLRTRRAVVRRQAHIPAANLPTTALAVVPFGLILSSSPYTTEPGGILPTCALGYRSTDCPSAGSSSGPGTLGEHWLRQLPTDEGAFVEAHSPVETLQHGTGVKNSRLDTCWSLKPEGANCYFWCEDSNARRKGTWRTKKTWHQKRTQ